MTNTSAQVNASVENTQPIPKLPQKTGQKDTETQKQPIQHQSPLDIEQDKKDNLFSSYNINNNALSDNDMPENQQQQNNNSYIVISTPPNSPDTQDETMANTPSGNNRLNPFRPIRSPLALRRRRFRASTPVHRPINRWSDSSDNNTSTDLLFKQLWNMYLNILQLLTWMQNVKIANEISNKETEISNKEKKKKEKLFKKDN